MKDIENLDINNVSRKIWLSNNCKCFNNVGCKNDDFNNGNSKCKIIGVIATWSDAFFGKGLIDKSANGIKGQPINSLYDRLWIYSDSNCNVSLLISVKIYSSKVFTVDKLFFNIWHWFNDLFNKALLNLDGEKRFIEFDDNIDVCNKSFAICNGHFANGSIDNK